MNAPKHVALVGLGPSMSFFVEMTKGLGGARALCDEVWGINALGDVLRCDRIFHMDDVRVQERRAAAHPDGNIAAMLKWMRKHPGPIVTSRAHPDYPGLVEFPLEDVISDLGTYYFNNTCAYAVAYAIHIGVEHLSIFGCDFTYPNAHHAEKGRACVEYWLGVAMSRGMKVTIPASSSLMDAAEPEEAKLYGYDTLKVTVEEADDGRAKVSFVEREEFATAAEIEARYDHRKHPNILVSGEAA